MEIYKVKNAYGEEMIVAMNDTHIIYPFLDVEWIYTTHENFNRRISNERENVIFRKSEGFKSIEDCVEYVGKYFV